MSKGTKRTPRMDGWENLATLLGTSADKRMASEIKWEYREPEFYEQLYAAGGIPARIVDLIPEESLRHWIEFTNVSKDEAETMNDMLEALATRDALAKSWKWGRGYGGGALHIVTDTPDPSSPLQVGEKVIGLRDLSRWDLRIMTTDVEFDFGSPNWGHPRIYYLNVQMGSQYKGYPIHWTRIIRFDGQLVPRRTYIRNNYWHDSVLNRLYNSIRNYEMANDAAAACLLDFNVDVYKMKNLANMIGGGKEKIIKNRIEMMNYSKSVLNAVMIDSDQEEYENKSRSMEGVAELLVHQANRLVAETDIPHTKLLGESPDGSQATGNSTSQSWYNFIATEQENYLRPKLKRLFQIIFPDKEELNFKFKSLRVLDEVERADVRLKVAQTDAIYLENQVVDPTEIAKSRWGGDEFSPETKIDWAAREDGSIVPGSHDLDEGDDEPNPDGPEGKSRTKTTPSEPEPGPMRGHEGEGKDITGKPKEKHPEPKGDADVGTDVEGSGSGEFGISSENPGTEFDFRNEKIEVPNSTPKTKSFIGQTMSDPFRDPRTDPHLKGPGIPNKPRTFLPTRGNGIIAQSGFDMQKDAGSHGVTREGSLRADGAIKNQVIDSEPRRATTVIVRRGDHFLMGATNEDGRWTLPGGMVEDGESNHQGGLRELAEETGLKAAKLKFVGSRLVENEMGKPTQVSIYEYHVDDKARPTGKNDPDKEVSKWQWFNSKEPLHKDVMANLKHPNNVALAHMKLLK